MVYQVIGLMSGSSRDGLDIVFVHLEEQRGNWSYSIKESACIPYSKEWEQALALPESLPYPAFLELHTRYGRYLGETVLAFIQDRGLAHQVHFIASHGHTAHHNPSAYTSFQLGDGAQIAALTGLPVISDLRSMDVALGGQGAPIVPIGDRLLFGEYQFWLNIGGIANLTHKSASGWVAGDLSAANQVFNRLAQQKGEPMDRDGALAAKGTVSMEVLDQLAAIPYYHQSMPKSLSNQQAMEWMAPLWSASLSVEDAMATAQAHLTAQVVQAIQALPYESGRMLVTGGGALNQSLM